MEYFVAIPIDKTKVEHYSVHFDEINPNYKGDFYDNFVPGPNCTYTLPRQAYFHDMVEPKFGIEERRIRLKITHDHYFILPRLDKSIHASEIAIFFGFFKFKGMRPEIYEVHDTHEKRFVGYHIIAYGIKHLWFE
jgi:hypothetical protein